MNKELGHTREKMVNILDRLEGAFVTKARGGLRVSRIHPVLLKLTKAKLSLVLVPSLVWRRARALVSPFAKSISKGETSLLLLGQGRDSDLNDLLEMGVASMLPEEPSDLDLDLAIARAFESMEAKARASLQRSRALFFEAESENLLDIARAMTQERDVEKLLSLILEKCRRVTSADAGSIYVVEAAGDGENAKLRFKTAQNDSQSLDVREFTIPLSMQSIAGSVALNRKIINIEDVYNLPVESTYHFDSRVDEKTGYRTRSMLTVPMISQRDEVIGVIQLLNRKRDPNIMLRHPDDVTHYVASFDSKSEAILKIVAAQAGTSLENALLYEEIRHLFDGFVHASVEAIEARDPTTSGHSRRVADLTVQLAKRVDALSHGPYAQASFSKEDLLELEYASLLHDFGKIGVREKVLVKAKKLYDEKLAIIDARFDFVIQTLETEKFFRQLKAMEEGAPCLHLQNIQFEFEARKQEIESYRELVHMANEPAAVIDHRLQRDLIKLEKIAKYTYIDLKGETKTLLETEEIDALNIQRGTLTREEYQEIASHVAHTFRFLSKIPWGKQFRRVPHIAGAHHERMNGTGYPNKLRAEEIPLQSKMMAVSDVFDALMANDRPYKKAVPIEKALEILELGVKDGHLDPELVTVFRETRVYQVISI